MSAETTVDISVAASLRGRRLCTWVIAILPFGRWPPLFAPADGPSPPRRVFAAPYAVLAAGMRYVDERSSTDAAPEGRISRRVQAIDLEISH
jgi:hypothetical protein